MSRTDSPSLNVRGVPRDVLNRLDAAARRQASTRNNIAITRICDYAAGKIKPAAAPPAFDPNRTQPVYSAETASLAINGIPKEDFARFTAKAKADGWFSKNQLIIELLRDV